MECVEGERLHLQFSQWDILDCLGVLLHCYFKSCHWSGNPALRFKMPGLIAFGRKWPVGSDDMWLPALIMLTVHSTLAAILIVSLVVLPTGTASEMCVFTMTSYTIGFIMILSFCSAAETAVLCLSMRGSLSHTELRSGIPVLVYLRLGLITIELFWLVLGVVWITLNYSACTDLVVLKGILFGAIVCCWFVLIALLSVSWVVAASSTPCVQSSDGEIEKKKNVQSSSDTLAPNVCNVCVDSINDDCRLSDFVRPSGNKYSLMAASRLFSFLLRDNDLLQTDIYAGVLLLLHKQKAHRACVLAQSGNEVYEFLSGVPITPSTRFLSLRLPEVQHNYKKTVHFMIYCIAEYRRWSETEPKNCWWSPLCGSVRMPSIPKPNSSKPCYTATNTRCHCWPLEAHASQGEKMLNATECIGCKRCVAVPIFHKEIMVRGRLSFSVSLDHVFKAVVVTISADLYLQEVLKGLGADSELIPVDPPHEDWHAHKDILQLAIDVRQALKDELFLRRAFCLEPEKGTSGYSLILVGHSLGAGVASVLSILLRSEYPSLHCYAYSPPGALLSATCAEDTKAFITSVIVGKDVFPRFGISQLESFEKDLVNSIKKSTEPKWKIIVAGVRASILGFKPDAALTRTSAPASVEIRPRQNHRPEGRGGGRCMRNGGSPMLFTLQAAMYPPGRIMHIVRSHPKNMRKLECSQKQVIYQAVWAENADFDQILVSPTMLSDHLPDTMFDAMKKVMTRVSPSKPSRKQAKPSREILIGSSEISHFTIDDDIEPVCTAASVQHTTCAVPGGFVSYDMIDCDPSSRRRSGGCTIAERNAKARSFPPAAVPPGSLYPVVCDLYGMAPLASPEALSESSSLASCGSNSLLYQRVVSCSLAFRMDPIIQSPSRSANSRDCCLFLEASDIVGDLTVLSPSVELLPSPLNPQRLSIEMVDKIAERSETEKCPPRSVIDVNLNKTSASSSNGLYSNKLQQALCTDILSETSLLDASHQVGAVVDAASVSAEPFPISFSSEGFQLGNHQQHSFEISSCSNVSLACSNESPVCVTSCSYSPPGQRDYESNDEYPDFLTTDDQYQTTDSTSLHTVEPATSGHDSNEGLKNGFDHSAVCSADECDGENSYDGSDI